jgi:hypothetical protein
VIIDNTDLHSAPARSNSPRELVRAMTDARPPAPQVESTQLVRQQDILMLDSAQVGVSILDPAPSVSSLLRTTAKFLMSLTFLIAVSLLWASISE